MSITISTNMNLPIPGVGTEAGPDYATDVNSALTLIDQHDHTPGSGVQITPAGLNITSDLSFQNNFATLLAGLTLTPQGSTPAISTIYESGVDLYFVDGNGNNVRLTQSGGVAGSPGSISNLTAPASAAYVAVNQTFVWQSNTSIAANMDCGSVLMRNLSPNSTYALTLSPPAGLAANYTVTLPSLPASTKIVTMTSGGTLSANYDVDNSTLAISSNLLIVKAGGIGTTQLANLSVTTGKIPDDAITSAKILNSAVTTAKIVDGAVTPRKRSTALQDISTGVTSIATTESAITSFTGTGRPVMVMVQIVDNTGAGPTSITFTNSFNQLQVFKDGVALETIYDTQAGNGGAWSGYTFLDPAGIVGDKQYDLRVLAGTASINGLLYLTIWEL